MRNLNGFLRKIQSRSRKLTFILLLISITLFSSLTNAFATSFDNSESIKIESVMSYSIDKGGELTGSVKLNLTNESSSPTIVKLYTLKIPFTGITKHSVRQFGTYLDTSTNNYSDRTDFIIDLEDEPLYGSKSIELAISFTIPGYLKKGNELTQFEIPTSIEGTDSDRVILQFENSWGDLKYILGASSSTSIGEAYTTLIFDSPTSPSATLVFKEISSYSFSIEKRLENIGDIEIVSEIAVPKSAHNQRVTFSKIEPIPDLAYKDDSGNTLFAYRLSPGYYIDINIEGSLSYVSNNEDSLQYPEINKYLLMEGLWEIDNKEGIKKFDTYLRANGIKMDQSQSGITQLLDQDDRERFYLLTYQYVINQLDYDPELTSGISVEGRSGASKSINGSDKASQEDYADLMITLLRYYGVPARMSIGYVTNVTERFENSFIHSWVEFWDSQTGWHIADPALSEILKTDMYDIKSLDHITMLHRINTPNTPNLQYFQSDKVLFKSIDVGDVPRLSVETSSVFASSDQINAETEGSIRVTNLGNAIIDSLEIEEKTVGAKVSLKQSEIIVPGQTVEIPITMKLDTSRLSGGKEKGLSLEFIVGAKSIDNNSYRGSHKSDVEIETFWWWDLLLEAFSTITFLLILFVAYNLYKYKVKSGSFLNNIVERLR